MQLIFDNTTPMFCIENSQKKNEKKLAMDMLITFPQCNPGPTSQKHSVKFLCVIIDYVVLGIPKQCIVGYY